MSRDKIVVLDFGSQYAHLIAKRFRLLGYYSEIALPSAPLSVFEDTKGIVFSGGPSSVYEKDVPQFNQEIVSLDIPILGLCYGHQLMAHLYGGTVGKAEIGEFGFAQLHNVKDSPLFEEMEFPAQVWMSHQDGVLSLPEGFEVIGATKDCPFAALQDLKRRRFGLQCHVEVKDTPQGDVLLQNFARYCGMEKNWDQNKVLDIIIAQIQQGAKDKNVLLFLSGGVDSTVAFALLNKALGQKRVLGLHIDNGFMRKNESAIIAQRYRDFGFTNFICEDASESFLKAVYKETDPQKKRKAVGENFITVRNQVVAAQNLDEEKWLLAQGTLYPDIIESGGTHNSHVIKTHHNRVDGIQALIAKGLIIEPLKDLYKDEVRLIGKKLGLSDELVMRHPFPGPGLAVRILGAITPEKVHTLQEADDIYIRALREWGLYNQVWQAGAILLSEVRSVGVMGDERTYENPVALRAVTSTDAMTADWAHLPYDFMAKVSNEIINKVKGVNRVCYDISSKPPSTIEWE